MQTGLLADQQPQMLAAGAVDAVRQQTAARRVGNPIVRIIEQAEVEPRPGQYLSRIRTQAPENRRQCHGGADTQLGFRVRGFCSASGHGYGVSTALSPSTF